MNAAGVLAILLCHLIGAEEEKPLVVAKDLTLEKGSVLRGGIAIRASHIILDGRGASVEGPGKPGDPKSYRGTGILIEGCSGVTVRNLVVRGFERGLAATGGEGLVIEGNDFTGNFHDPDFGWGERPPLGGIVLARISRSVIRKNVAREVWDGLALFDCHENRISENDFSHTSDTALKLWMSTGNTVEMNNLSYGIRIVPGEVHARDSTGVLIESGSDGNRFFRNDISHGGDGVFIRALNGWVSTGNIFIENDCSWANNNCVESWCPGNIYIRNTANHGSYGFWLGGSDRTVLLGNEAAWNGLPDGPHNAPEPGFGHGGIVIVGGASSHTLIEGNRLHHNRGAGIAFRGDDGTKGKKWRTHHWIVQMNAIEGNRFGIWGRWGDWIHLANNVFRDNAEGNFLDDVSALEEESDPSVARAPAVSLRGPERAVAGRPVLFDASGSADPAGRPLSFRWDLGGAIETRPSFERVFERPGFYRVGLTVSNGVLAGLGSRDLIVVRPVQAETGTEGEAARWGFEMDGNADGKGRVLFADDPDALVGRTSLRFTPDPYKGMYATAIFPGARDARWNLSGKSKLTFWMKARNQNIPGFQEPGPVIRLYGKDGAVKIQPSGGRNLLVGLPFNEARWVWMPVEVPLGGDGNWTREVSGSASLDDVRGIGISLDSWGGDPFTVWIDGLSCD